MLANFVQKNWIFYLIVRLIIFNSVAFFSHMAGFFFRSACEKRLGLSTQLRHILTGQDFLRFLEWIQSNRDHQWHHIWLIVTKQYCYQPISLEEPTIPLLLSLSRKCVPKPGKSPVIVPLATRGRSVSSKDMGRKYARWRILKTVLITFARISEKVPAGSKATFRVDLKKNLPCIGSTLYFIGSIARPNPARDTEEAHTLTEKKTASEFVS